MSFDSSRYQVPSSNWIAGYLSWPVPSISSVRLSRDVDGPGTRSYSIRMSLSAFSTRQHGWALILTHCPLQRCSFTAIRILLGPRRRSYDTGVRAVFEIRPPAWGETLAVLQSVSLPDGP